MRTSKTAFLVSTTLLLLFLSQCKKKDAASTLPKPDSVINIYVCGYEGNAAMIWKNSTATALTDGINTAKALAICTVGRHVYTCGFENNASGNAVAKLWEGGTAKVLSDGSTSVVATGIFASGTDVYVCANNGTVWKNGVATTITGGNAIGISVVGADIYTCEANGTVRKNGVPQNNISARGLTARSFLVSGNDIYVCGENAPGAQLWKNGARTSLTGNNQYVWAKGLSVAGTTVYVCGYQLPQYKYEATIWKNGTPIILADEKNAVARSVYATDNDVYACGYDYDSPIYRSVFWKNGVLQPLTNSTKAAEAFGIIAVDQSP